MKSFNVFHLPILDDSNNFVGLYITSELAPKNTLSETVVIMAVVKARLMPLTAIPQTNADRKRETYVRAYPSSTKADGSKYGHLSKLSI